MGIWKLVRFFNTPHPDRCKGEGFLNMKTNCGRKSRKLIAELFSRRWLPLFALFIIIFVCARRITGAPITEPKVCLDSFGENPVENLRKMATYRFPAIEPYMKLVFPKYTVPNSTSVRHEVGQDPKKIPAIVTGASYNHFWESLHLIQHLNSEIRPAYKDMRLIYYDFGLSEEQRKEINDICNCEIRKFPFDKLPRPVSVLKGFAWKVVAIQFVLNEYPFVLWLDSCVRFKTNNLTPFFDQTIKYGVVATVRNDTPLAASTYKESFEFLNETPCLYRYFNFAAGMVAIYQSEFIKAYFMQPWVSCALSLECMVIDYHPRLHFPCFRHKSYIDHHYHQCHMYDQSVMSILMFRLFNHEIEKHYIEEFGIYAFCKEGERWEYLPGPLSKLIAYGISKCQGCLPNSPNESLRYVCKEPMFRVVS